MMGRGAGQPGYPGGQQDFPGQRMPGQPGHPGQKRPWYGGYEHSGGPGGPSYQEDHPASSQQNISTELSRWTAGHACTRLPSKSCVICNVYQTS